MNDAGVDISSHAIDVVLLDEDTDRAAWHRFTLSGRTPFDRARSLRATFPTRSFWEEHGVYLVGLEDPIGMHPHTAKALGIALGSVAALLPPGLTAFLTTPDEWQKLFVGGWEKRPRTSAERKRLVREAAMRRGFASDLFPQDAYDAAGIAWAVRDLNREAIQRGAA